MANLKPKGVAPKKTDEREFNRMVRGDYLIPFLNGALDSIRRSGATTVAGELGALWAFVRWWIANRDPEFPVDRVSDWAHAIDLRHAKAFNLDVKRLGSAMPRPDYRATTATTEDIVASTVAHSVSLIKTIPERFHASLAVKLTKAEKGGLLDLEDRRKLFKDTGKLSGYVLRRLTRDQANKLAGALSIHRLREAGFQSYRWSTSLDERVRTDHAEREGKVYPVITGTGIALDRHPGEAIQCRCVAVPVVESRAF